MSQRRPNVLIILIDDMGFGGPSAFGGPCRMPTAERLAEDGLKYTRFHVNALCSPTRQSLLTGRNNHAVAMGATTEYATAAPGYTSVRPDSAAPLARVLRDSGYSTAAFGKMHQTPQWEVSPVGPFDRWPTGEGFEKFYGFLAAEMNHCDPLLFDGTRPVEPNPDHDPEYHLSEDLASKGIEWLELQHSLAPDKPFFMYLAMGACHSPLQVPQQWRERYAGAFAGGWDELRETTLARQKALGVVAEDAVLSPWAEGLPSWEELSAEEQRVSQAFMETYAAVAEHVDAQVGRVIESLRGSGRLDDTLIFYILGDNGASGEGGVHGSLNSDRAYSAIPESAELIAEHLDELGGPRSFPLHPAGWSVAMSTPYQWTKQIASHFGGTRDGMVVHWPAGMESHGEVRHQWHHVIDVYPTVLDAAGVEAPDSVGGVAQQRLDGLSMRYTFDGPHEPERRHTQYFEMLGNRAIYHDGWIASIKHLSPWKVIETDRPRFEDETWQLYDLTSDWSQALDVADAHPEVVRRMAELFQAEAERNNVFPLDDRSGERLNAAIAGRPELQGGREEMVLLPGATRLAEDAVINLKNRSHTVRASIEVGPLTNGVVIAQGSRFGGWCLHLWDGRPTYTYNYFAIEATDLVAPDPLQPGEHEVLVTFDYRSEGTGGPANVTLAVDGRDVGSTSLERTTPFLFSCWATLDVGTDLGAPVSDRYDARSPVFEGRVRSVALAATSHARTHVDAKAQIWAHQ